MEYGKRYFFVIYTLEFVSNTLRFGYALGLEKGLYNPNRVVFDTTLRACGTTVRVLMPL